MIYLYLLLQRVIVRPGEGISISTMSIASSTFITIFIALWNKIQSVAEHDTWYIYMDYTSYFYWA